MALVTFQILGTNAGEKGIVQIQGNASEGNESGNENGNANGNADLTCDVIRKVAPFVLSKL